MESAKQYGWGPLAGANGTERANITVVEAPTDLTNSTNLTNQVEQVDQVDQDPDHPYIITGHPFKLPPRVNATDWTNSSNASNASNSTNLTDLVEKEDFEPDTVSSPPALPTPKPTSPGERRRAFFCFLKKLSEVRMLTTFYLTKTATDGSFLSF